MTSVTYYPSSPSSRPLPSQQYKVLLPLANLEEAKILLPLAEDIAKSRQGQLTLLLVLTVPEGQTLSEAAGQASRLREALTELLSEQLIVVAQVKTMVRFAHEIWDGVWEIVSQDQIDLLLMSWRNASLTATALGVLLDDRLDSPPCEVVAVWPSRQVAESLTWDDIGRILLPVRGGPNSALTLRIGHALAKRTGANITLFHVTNQTGRESDSHFFDEFAPALRDIDQVTRSVTTKGEIPEAILTEVRDHQAVVMGAPSNPTQPGSWHGPILDAVMANPDIALIAVKDRRPQLRTLAEREEPVTVKIDRPVAVVVDEWFAENTYHSREFSDLERLVALKEEQRLTISLGLPALNEEKTVGNVIKTVKAALMDELPLLDEIALIDSGSVDYTREIASDLGIPVYIHREILPEYGAYHGKGEALWKSLYVLNGDIVAWIDTDIRNIHPRFVYGVLGPTLRDPNIKYAKGYYRRPLRQGEKLVAGGGGRVTELTARPFFNLFFPELSGLIQPLSGEYAGRRDALERLSFFTGYGVETGLLIDILTQFGLHAIAQVDLLERIHHNQPLPSLSKMSFTIMQVVFNRLEERHKIDLLEDANLTMNLIRFGPNRYYLEPEELREHERPPMISIPEYRLKRNLGPVSR